MPVQLKVQSARPYGPVHYWSIVTVIDLVREWTRMVRATAERFSLGKATCSKAQFDQRDLK